MTGESNFALAIQGTLGVALLAAAVFLAYIDPSSRPLLEGSMVGGVGTVIGYFFSQRAQANGVHAATNGMSTAAALIASAVPGPTGATGDTGATGRTGPTGPPGAVVNQGTSEGVRGIG